MGLQVNLPSQAVTTTNTRIRLKMLPLNVRVPGTTTVTIAASGTNNSNVTVGAAAVRGATSLTMSSVSHAIPAQGRIKFANGAQAILTTGAAANATSIQVAFLSGDVPSGMTGIWNSGSVSIGSQFLPVNALTAEIDAGEVLTFGSQRITVTDYAPAGSTVLEILELTSAATVGATASTQNLLTVAGATDATPSSAPKTVDATTYNSGVGKEMLVTGVSATLKIGYNLIVGDRGGDVITSLLLNPDNYNREVYAVVSRPFDGIYEGAAIVTNNSDTAPVQDIAKRTADMQFQGTSFKFTKFPSF